jgi:hypothetical protein
MFPNLSFANHNLEAERYFPFLPQTSIQNHHPRPLAGEGEGDTESKLLKKVSVAFALNLLILACIHASAGAANSLPGKWQIRASMPSARTEVAAAELGGKIFVMGGLEKHGDRVEQYDPVNDTWRRRAALPRPLHHFGAAAVNGKIYIIGGYISGVGSVNTVYQYDPATDRWH